jgi:hypothetical protein
MQALSQLGHLNLKQLGILIEAVWERKDRMEAEGDESGAGITWQGTMKDMGWALLVV